MKQIEIYERDGGFCAGRELKGGGMSADTHRITGEEILTMFAARLRDHCRREGTDKIMFHDADGNVYVAARVKTEIVADKKE